MSSNEPISFTLNNNIEMPAIGLGVLFAENEGEVEYAVKSALDAGYRKIDTASAYQNEEGVGRAIKSHDLERADIFLATKVWNTEQGYDKTLKAIDQSLEKLQMDYVDLYLIHWPVPNKYRETYRALEEIYSSGKAKAIGVCNFSIEQLEDLIANSSIVPAVNKVEMHPHLSQKELLVYCHSKGIRLEAWRPIMMGEVFQIPEIVDIGKKYSKSAIQVTLRWMIQRGVSVIPKSVTKERIIDNFEVFDFELLPEDMQTIESLNKNRHLGEDLSHVQ